MTPEEIQKATLYHSEDELLQLGKTAVDNLMQYGATTWYDWRTRGDTWNTKWNSYNAYDYNGGNEICFQTAWSAPHPIIEKLSAMYPEVTIKHSWANEDLWQGCGIVHPLDSDTRAQLFKAVSAAYDSHTQGISNNDLPFGMN